ncbi:MAG: serine/threonine-protein kinase, partial [Thermoleophilia bacterium]
MSSSQARVFAGRYRVIRRLGAGGTAAVFLARDERLGREVAVKRLHGAEVTAQTAQRLRREARIMASMRHPNLVTVYDMLMDEDDLLLVMEYVRGETLADVLASAPLGWERTLELLEPVAAALDQVHNHGVVHRDLKPSNILVGPGSVVKVADLGLATAAEITKITPPGTIMGTPAYIAPEQARAGACTPMADVYSLATIAFQVLSGTLPRSGTTVVAVL